MKFIRALLISFFSVAAVVTIIGYLLPTDWEIERSVIIKAPPEQIYPYVSNFREGWTQWNTFNLLDPGIRITYAGPTSGVGAERSWVSKNSRGSQKIKRANPDWGVEFELHLAGNPFVYNGEIRFEPAQEGTKVSWRYFGSVGENPYYRYMVFSMDDMIGENQEKSLLNLKEKVEATLLPVARESAY